MGVQISSSINSNFKSIFYEKYRIAAVEALSRKRTANNSGKAAVDSFFVQKSEEIDLNAQPTEETQAVKSLRSTSSNYDRLELSKNYLQYLQFQGK